MKSIVGVSAVVLAGGKSRRMGRSKAWLPFDGVPLIVQICRSLEGIFDEVVVVAAPGQKLPRLEARLVHDEVPHQGPVGGIYYGLRSITQELAFVISCDVPFCNGSLVRYLVSLAPGYDVVVPVWKRRLQPVFAVYRRSLEAALKDLLDRGKLRPMFLFRKVRTLKVRDREIRRFDPEGLSFLNLNTPNAYRLALKRWEGLRDPYPPL